MLFDHVDQRVGDLATVRALYDALLPAMGYSNVSEDDNSICYYAPDGEHEAAFYGIIAEPDHRPNGTRIALRANSRDEVDRLAAIAYAAGATAFEAPAVIDDYRPVYYAAFFEDAEGNKLELCYRERP